MDELLAVVNEQGWLFAIGLYLLFNLPKIGAGLERIAGRFFPTWAEERRLKLEMRRDEARRGREAREQERTDTITALKEMLISYRDTLAKSDIERQRCQAELVHVVGNYERYSAEWLAAFRDVSGVLREQGRRLDAIFAKMMEVIDGK